MGIVRRFFVILVAIIILSSVFTVPSFAVNVPTDFTLSEFELELNRYLNSGYPSSAKHYMRFDFDNPFWLQYYDDYAQPEIYNFNRIYIFPPTVASVNYHTNMISAVPDYGRSSGVNYPYGISFAYQLVNNYSDFFQTLHYEYDEINDELYSNVVDLDTNYTILDFDAVNIIKAVDLSRVYFGNFDYSLTFDIYLGYVDESTNPPSGGFFIHSITYIGYKANDQYPPYVLQPDIDASLISYSRYDIAFPFLAYRSPSRFYIPLWVSQFSGGFDVIFDDNTGASSGGGSGGSVDVDDILDGVSLFLDIHGESLISQIQSILDNALDTPGQDFVVDYSGVNTESEDFFNRLDTFNSNLDSLNSMLTAPNELAIAGDGVQSLFSNLPAAIVACIIFCALMIVLSKFIGR